MFMNGEYSWTGGFMDEECPWTESMCGRREFVDGGSLWTANVYGLGVVIGDEWLCIDYAQQMLMDGELFWRQMIG